MHYDERISILKRELGTELHKKYNMNTREVDLIISLAKLHISQSLEEKAKQSETIILLRSFRGNEVAQNPLVAQIIDNHSHELEAKLGLTRDTARRVSEYTITQILHRYEDITNEENMDKQQANLFLDQLLKAS
jgi:hypothetical protein